MRKLRALTGAVLCTVALSLLGTLGPPGSGLFLVAAAIAGLILGGWYGWQSAAYCTAASALLIVSIGGPSPAALYLALVGLPTIAAVCALQGDLRIERVMAVTVGTLAICGTIVLWASVGEISTLRDTFLDAWRNSFDQSIALYAGVGVSEDTLSELEASRDELGQTLLEVLPALAVVLSGVLWLVSLRLAGRWVAWPQTRGWRIWQTPVWLIWLLIGSGFAMLLPVDEIAIPSRNVFAITLACYFCQGLAIVSYYLQRFGMPRGLRVASYLLIGIQQIVAGLVLILGIFDFWGDFRRLEPRPADASIGSDSD